MKKEKKLYQVFKKVTDINNLDEIRTYEIPIGYTKAVSDKQAITFVKYQNGIKTKNCYTRDYNYGSCEQIIEFVAEEVEDK
ncbi:MAG: hypothetical protein IJ094_12985 [Bacilli bacterium]|nr:hypothetical protein [Bacilli bacterium]